MSASKPPYFIDKKGEVNELRALLRNHALMRVPGKKRDIIKKVNLDVNKNSTLVNWSNFSICWKLGDCLHDTRDRRQPLVLGHDACKCSIYDAGIYLIMCIFTRDMTSALTRLHKNGSWKFEINK